MDNLPPPHVSTSPAADTEKDARMWAMLCHLSSFAGYVLTVPFAGVIGPLVIWLIKKDEFPEVDEHGKEAVNFQISVAIYSLVGLALIFVLIGFVVLGVLLIFDLVCVIQASVKANKGEHYEYPLCIRFVK